MPNRKIIFYSTFLSPPTSLLDFFSLLSESVSLSQVPNRVLPLLTIRRKQEEGDGGGNVRFAERSGFDF